MGSQLFDMLDALLRQYDTTQAGQRMKARSTPRSDIEDGQRRLAVLIDADNAQPSIIEGLLAEVARFGVASVKRIYGDFTSTQATQWKQKLLAHSINPVQQFAYTTGKNATDSSLIIDAMDLMYTGRFDGMCLVSSDSDFTRLAQRLREEGLVVYGFGERKTPDAFVQACDKFIYTDILRASAVAGAKAVGKAAVKPAQQAPAKVPAKLPSAAAATTKAAANSDPPGTTQQPIVIANAATTASPAGKPLTLEIAIDLIRRAIEEASDEQGWAFLGAVGSYVNKLRPDFDPRLFNQRKLSDLVRHLSKQFATEERGAPDSTSKSIYVRTLG